MHEPRRDHRPEARSHGANRRGEAGASARWCVVCALLLTGAGAARAERLAVFRLDSLGVPAPIVARLDGLLRMEVGRLADAALPGKAQVAALLRRRPELRGCTGGVACLSTVGELLDVHQIISGNVGGLADSFVVNLKLVDVKSRREVRRIQETMSGSADQLIEAVRVATYGLIAPERLRGALSVLVSLAGADVYLNGKLLGKSPLPVQHGLPVGSYTLRVRKRGYGDALQLVKVRFQKTAEVIVRLQAPAKDAGQRVPEGGSGTVGRPLPWYTQWWFWTAVGVAAAGVGAALGWGLSGSPGINCDTEPRACGL